MMKRLLRGILLGMLLNAAAVAGENLFPAAALRQAEAWYLPEGYQWRLSEGKDGSGAVYYCRPSADSYVLATVELTGLQPGELYEYGGWVKAAQLGDGAEVTPAFCVEFHDADGKYLTGDYGAAAAGERDWTLLKGEFAVPEEAVTATFTPYLRPDTTGEAWFSNFFLHRKDEVRWVTALRDYRGSLPVRQAAVHLTGTVYNLPENLRNQPLTCKASFLNAAGEERQSRCFEWSEGVTELALPDDCELLALELYAPDGATLLGRSSHRLRRIDSERRPENACWIDERGRAWVNGAKFLPIGLYIDRCGGRNIGAEIPAIAAGSFNCVMPYDTLVWQSDDGAAGAAAIRGELDRLEAAGLKIIFSLKDIRDNGWIREWEGTTGELAVLDKVVETFRNHPALLAWYICDEDGPEMYERLKVRRELVNGRDPWHPTWLVTCHYDTPKVYMAGADVYGIDPYPIGYAGSDIASVKSVLRRTVAGLGENMALWAVPQIFNQGVYWAGADWERYRKYVDPTEEEMLGIVLLEAIYGAKGFVMYSYFDLKRGPDRELFDRQWPKVCRVAAELEKLAPYLLGDPAGPAFDCRMLDGQLAVQSFTADDGRQAVVIVAPSKEGGRAELDLPESGRFHSRFGRTVRQPDGSWRFASEGVGCDILYAE